MVVFGTTSPRMVDKGKDEMGGWSHFPLEAKDNKKILTVSVCQSCKTTSTGLQTFDVQQRMMMSLQNRPDVNPRKNFQQDASAFLTEQLEKHADVTPMTL